jgi:signal-transduction protein with cAMP-binding, CBS, and nucleotidyltransferase domain
MFIKIMAPHGLMETGYKISDLMNQNVLTTTSRTTLKDCAVLMADKKIGSLIIVDDEKVVGIVTEQDLARKVVARGLEPAGTLVSEIMSKDVVDIMPSDDVYTAMVRMSKYDIKHLPVIHAGELVGIISFKDILKAEPALIEKMWASRQ